MILFNIDLMVTRAESAWKATVMPYLGDALGRKVIKCTIRDESINYVFDYTFE